MLFNQTDFLQQEILQNMTEAERSSRWKLVVRLKKNDETHLNVLCSNAIETFGFILFDCKKVWNH